MRAILNAVLAFIGAESLTDEEYEDLIPDDLPEGYTLQMYNALKAVLLWRESVSAQVRKLQLYFLARGVEVADEPPPSRSNIFVGADLKKVSNAVKGLTSEQLTALINVFTDTLKGLVPPSGGGTEKFLRADGQWASTDGQGDVEGPSSSTDNAIARFDSTTGKLIQNTANATVADSGEITSASLTASRALVSGSSKEVQSSSVTSTELGYVSGVTSALQTQLNAKEPSLTGAATSIASSNLTASRAVVSDVSGKVSAATTTAAEIGYVNGVTSAIQTQLDAKQATVTGGATSITSSDLTVSRALVSDGSGKVSAATTTATEIGYVNGVTSAIQTQIDSKAAGASSSTDNAVPRFDSTTGKILQGSGVTIDDSNNLTVPGTGSHTFSGTVKVVATGTSLELNADGSNAYIGTSTSDRIRFYTASQVWWDLETSGHLTPVFNNNNDIGSSSLRMRNVNSVTGTLDTVTGVDASGSNAVASNLVLQPGQSTGNATPASVVIQGTSAGSSGSTAQTLVDLATFQGLTATIAGTLTSSLGLVAGNTAQTSLVPAIIAYRGGGYATPIFAARANSGTNNWCLFVDGSANFSVGTSADTPWMTANSTTVTAKAKLTVDGLLSNTPQTPTQITANQNNYAPTSASILRLSTDASRNITGLSISQVSGSRTEIWNVGSFDIVLKHADGASTAANQFTCNTGADITLAAGEEALLKYDGVTSRWRVRKIA
jgi:hypothetical protein